MGSDRWKSPLLRISRDRGEGLSERGVMARILLVDDEASVLETLTEILESAGHDVTATERGEEALRLAEEHPFDIAIIDLIMPHKEGIETIMTFASRHPETKIIAISGGGRVAPDRYLAMARKLGARQTLAKPFTSEALLAAVEALHPQSEAEGEE
ncbi:MAG: response regulator [Deltaproteobacteria bacterium]|nr:MAG: response regulator [Deltaproteobacteria bacterium]